MTTTLVDFGNVGIYLFNRGLITAQQRDAFIELGKQQRQGATLEEGAIAFTPLWRSSPPLNIPKPQPVSMVEVAARPSTAPPAKRNSIYQALVRLTNVRQPDEVTCQAAVCAMLTGQPEDQVQVIRRTLQSFGKPGDPLVMARYLTSKLGQRYQLVYSNLDQVAKWLKDGYAVGTHGWHTRPGHVCVLDGVTLGEDGVPIYYSVKDSEGQFDGERWQFVGNTRFYDGNISTLLAYSLFVVNSNGMAGSRQAYRRGRVDLKEGGMICHRVAPPSADATPRNRYEITPERKAILETIAYAEGTRNSKGYNTIFSYKYFDDFSDHPRRVQRSNGYSSDAAGRYQFLSTTWDEVRRAMRLPDFSPTSQDQAALWLIDRKRKALGDVDRRDLRAALEKLSWEWASLPPSRYGQPQKTYQELYNVFMGVLNS